MRAGLRNATIEALAAGMEEPTAELCRVVRMSYVTTRGDTISWSSVCTGSTKIGIVRVTATAVTTG
jgi:hypothetical protein